MRRWIAIFGLLCSLSLAPLAGTAAAAGEPDETTPLDVPEPTALALQFHRTGNWIWVFGRIWDLAVPAVVLVSGLSGRLWVLSRRVGRVWIAAAAVYFFLYLLIGFIVDFPFAYFTGFVRQHAYGLSTQSFGKWLGDALKDLAIGILGVACFAWVPFVLIRRFPRTWWLITALLAVPFIAFVMLIAPVWIDPLYNEFGPMKDKALEAKILALAHRAGIDDSRVFEVNKSIDTKTANAYVKGLFGSKRIVLWDTLLKNFDENEVLAVMGHEMGHYALNHVGWSIAASSIVLLAGLWWTDRAGRWLLARHQSRFGFNSLSDVAATPLLVILMGVSSTVLAPLALAYSRYHEHEADRFSLELTRLNRSAARAFADFQRENLSIPRPNPLLKLWRSSHPSVAERIEFCNTYRPWAQGKTLRYSQAFSH
jgi:Zn-dependent protease with chaperone function